MAGCYVIYDILKTIVSPFFCLLFSRRVANHIGRHEKRTWRHDHPGDSFLLYKMRKLVIFKLFLHYQLTLVL